MKNSRQTPSIHAGSMADIAFLLLIFFLVTTVIPNDKGIERKLPRDCEEPPCALPYLERNVLRLQLNKEGEIFANENLIPLKELKKTLMVFIDNNGDNSCDYCKGEGATNFSENPTKAVIALQSDRESSYKDYIAIQVELNKAYLELREQYVSRAFDERAFSELSQEEMKQVREAYPLLFSEAFVKQ